VTVSAVIPTYNRTDSLCDLALPRLELKGTLLELLAPSVEFHVGPLQLLEELLGAHAGPDQVDGQDCQHDGEAGEERDPPRTVDVLDAFKDHAAPRRGGRRHAEACH